MLTKDLTGLTFGLLTVLEEDFEKEAQIKQEKHYSKIFYKCQCSCENHTIVTKSYQQLTTTKNPSCGCAPIIMPKRTGPLKNGTRYGKLVVQYEDKETELIRNDKKEYYFCQCDCGNTKIVCRNNLVTGDVRSCGCLYKETPTGFKPKHNTFEIDGDIVYGYTDKNERFIFDLQFLEEVKKHYWYITNQGYVETSLSQGGFLKLHKFVTNTDATQHIDHINRQRNDCRLLNLRYSGPDTNSLNHSVGINNKSGVIGVSYLPKKKRWVMTIQRKGIVKISKYYKTFEDAVRARLQAEKEYFGEFAPQRHLFEQYGIEDDIIVSNLEYLK